ncbi:MAG: AI-2E family transporter [Microthrixaceae bacterium]
MSPASLARAVLVVGAGLAIAAILVLARHPLMWFLEAAVLAALAAPAVERLRRHVPAWVAVLGITAATVAVVAALAAAGFTELRAEAERFQDTVPAAAARLQARAPMGGYLTDIDFSGQARELGRTLMQRFDLSGTDLPGAATAVGGRLSAAFIVWVLAVMLLFAGRPMLDATIDAAGPQRAPALRSTLAGAYRRALGYLALTTLRALALALVVWLAASLLGVDMPIVLAVVAFVLGYLPHAGVALAGVPLALLAVLQSPGRALAVLGGAVALQVVDALVLQPRIRARTFRMGMLPTLVVAAIGISLYGAAGLFIAVPLGCLGMAWLQEWADRDVPDAAPGDTDDGSPPADPALSEAVAS